MSETLKPCPFCKGTTFEIRTSPKSNSRYVHCKCGAEGPPGLWNDGAITQWNTRPVKDELRAENEQLRTRINKLDTRLAEIHQLALDNKDEDLTAMQRAVEQILWTSDSEEG
jgi:Lar family restriction alleviation protein